MSRTSRHLERGGRIGVLGQRHDPLLVRKLWIGTTSEADRLPLATDRMPDGTGTSSSNAGSRASETNIALTNGPQPWLNCP